MTHRKFVALPPAFQSLVLKDHFEKVQIIEIP